MKLNLSAGLAAGLIAFSAAPAAASPVTVDLRIEGPTRTLFEGPVTTDVRPFHFTGGPGYTCDGTAPFGTAAAPAVTRGAAFTAAEEAAPFTAAGTWHAMYGPSFTQIAGESVAYDGATNRYLVEYLNAKPSMTGSCGETVGAGDNVLYAYGTGSEPLLALSGPATVKPGESATLKVTDAATGAPVAGATVDGRQSGADGSVLVGPLTARGAHDQKAAKDGAIRSNRVQVCVTDGSDGACGSPSAAPGPLPLPALARPDTTAPTATLSGLTDHAVLSKGPRELRGSFADPNGVKVLKLRLTKRAGKRCWYFSGSSERFRGTRCGHGPYFAIPAAADWSYLLPSRLGPGRYVLDAVAIDGAGNRTPLARGTTRVVFTVR
jgi:hypothetical protein